MKDGNAAHVVLASVAAASLVAGFSGGLGRLGLAPVVGTPADLHGALMICGFFGTLISLERAVADGRRTMLAVPALAAAGSVLAIGGWITAGAAAWLLAGLGLAALTVVAAARLPTLFTRVMTVAALLWPIGTAAWIAGWALSEVAYTWLAFLVLTITAERIELARLTRPGSASVAILMAVLALLLGALAIGQPSNGSAILAAALGGLGLWLIVNDIALVTVRGTGLARFSAVCLLLGYGWLLVAAAMLGLVAPADSAFGHDVAVHAIAIGFVLSMVFAHAPIILPAVTGAPVRYTPFLYGPVAALQLSVALRTVGGVLQSLPLVSTSAWLTVAAFASYAVLLAVTAILPRFPKHSGQRS